MAGGSALDVSNDLRNLFDAGTVAGLSDEQLLGRFREGSREEGEGAFAALLERHGPMVRRVCGRILGDPHDTDDASQATFLVLARKAGSIRRSESLASWLFGVAGRVARRARADAARRRDRELCRAESESPWTVDHDTHEPWHELYEELHRLPEKFRVPIVLFHLEGQSYEQAAQVLQCPVRTIQSRLARGRERLRSRLVRRGLGPAVALLVADPTAESAAAAVTDAWKQKTTHGAVSGAARGAATASVSAAVLTLAEGAINAMVREKLRLVLGLALLIAVAAGGVIAQSTTPERKPHNDARYHAKFKDGTSIEVVGISTHPSGPSAWWGPDGTPLDSAPADPSPNKLDDPHRNVRAVLVRVSDLPEGATLKWLPTDVNGYWGGRPTKNGEKMKELDVYVASFPRDLTHCSVKARIASGGWETNASHDGTGGFSTTKGSLKFYFGKARPYRGGTAIAVAENIVDRDTRFVAVDRQGRVHTAVYSSGGGGAILSLLDVEFRVPPEDILEYQVQSRPFEHVEIKDIALQPRKNDE